MKKFLYLLIFGSCSSIIAQEVSTIYTNEREVVALFFPEPIQQALVGSERFTFSFNRASPQHIGVLQGLPGAKSNLLVLTRGGAVYSYKLAFKEVLERYTYFIPNLEAIGTERPISSIPVDSQVKEELTRNTQVTSTSEYDYRTAYFERFGLYYLEHTKSTKESKRKKGVSLRMWDMVYDRDEVYVILSIKNKSGIDFELDYTKIFMEHGSQHRKASYQKRELELIYSIAYPKMVKHDEEVKFVLVFPKFTFGDEETLLLEIQEFNGNRQLNLRI